MAMGRGQDDDEDRDTQDRDWDDDEDREERAGDEEVVGGREYRPWTWAVVSSLVIVLGFAMLLAYPGEARQARRYADAEPCSAPGTIPPTCVELVPAVVEGTRTVGLRRPDYYVDVRVGEGATFPPPRHVASVEVEDTGQVYDSLRAGDRVEVGYWGRNIARITKPGVGTVETVGSPTFDAGVTLGLGVALPVVGGLSLRFAVRLRRRTGSWTKKGAIVRGHMSCPRAAGAGALAGFIVGSLVVADSNTYDVSEAVAVWVVTGLAGAVVGVVLVFLVRVLRRARSGRGR